MTIRFYLIWTFLVAPSVLHAESVPKKWAVPSSIPSTCAPYDNYLACFCRPDNPINRADGEMYKIFRARAKALSSEVINDYPFRVMRDPALQACWVNSAEVIGWAGDDRAVEGLYTHLRAFHFPPDISLADFLRQFDAIPRMAIGLAIAASYRRGTALADKWVEFIIERTYVSYWRKRLPTGRAPAEAAKRGIDWGLFDDLGSRLAVGPLCATGSEVALARLYTFRAEALVSEYRGGNVSSIDMNIGFAHSVIELGMDAFADTHAGAL